MAFEVFERTGPRPGPRGPQHIVRDEEIRRSFEAGASRTELASAYGMSYPRICQIVSAEDAAMDPRHSHLDPRWVWIEVTALDSAEPEYIKGMCRHTEVISVDGLEGETVAHLCLTCDRQLPEEWVP